MTEPTVTHCTLRDGGDETHIECRMTDGQKGAFVRVDCEFTDLAKRICDFLNGSSTSGMAMIVGRAPSIADAIARERNKALNDAATLMDNLFYADYGGKVPGDKIRALLVPNPNRDE